jgi:hypothetical protein
VTNVGVFVVFFVRSTVPLVVQSAQYIIDYIPTSKARRAKCFKRRCVPLCLYQNIFCSSLYDRYAQIKHSLAVVIES